MNIDGVSGSFSIFVNDVIQKDIVPARQKNQFFHLGSDALIAKGKELNQSLLSMMFTNMAMNKRIEFLNQAAGVVDAIREIRNDKHAPEDKVLSLLILDGVFAGEFRPGLEEFAKTAPSI